MSSFSQLHPMGLGGEFVPGQINYIREIISLDVMCPHCCTFIRDKDNKIQFQYPPTALHWSRQFEYPWALYHGEVSNTHDVLEVGSGWSVLKFVLGRRAKSVVCLEPDLESLNKSQETIDSFGFKNITQVKGDVRELPFPALSFDRVFCISVLEHVPDNHEQCIKEMMRVLRPGGVLLLTLDVVMRGKCNSNFYLDEEKIVELCEKGVLPTPQHPGLNKIMGADMKEGVSIMVLLSKLVKE